ncbi:hypothetical protein HME9302_02265 [Alteripontixanthobacter maritimus]|uniref:Uncharacterized protein n=1 Tax=Alteripontixanthobacter maritimus TaxID=2161824 RepID=A0A369QFH6_9SPHN|nr:hypothetical protein [Alteripontixanthobacter maritimus]RDC61048.1 hypothetical protein HME9302_02265 [Alteripontixanthobacter maritimus]
MPNGFGLQAEHRAPVTAVVVAVVVAEAAQVAELRAQAVLAAELSAPAVQVAEF